VLVLRWNFWLQFEFLFSLLYFKTENQFLNCSVIPSLGKVLVALYIFILTSKNNHILGGNETSCVGLVSVTILWMVVIWLLSILFPSAYSFCCSSLFLYCKIYIHYMLRPNWPSSGVQIGLTRQVLLPRVSS
jgi:hypothetical protein